MGSNANNTVLPIQIDVDDDDDNAWCTGVMIPESEEAAMLDDEDDISIFGSHAEFLMTPTTTVPMPTPIITCRPTFTTFSPMDNGQQQQQPPRRVSAEGDAISAFSTAMSPQAKSPPSASPLAILASAAASRPTTVLHTPLSLPTSLSSVTTPKKVTKTKRTSRTSLKTKLSRPVLEKPPTEQDYLRLHRKQVQEAYRLNSAVYHSSTANTIKTILHSKASLPTKTATAKKKASPPPTMTEEQYLQMYEAQSTALRDRNRILQPTPQQQQQQQPTVTPPQQSQHTPPTVASICTPAMPAATTTHPAPTAPLPLCSVSASMTTRMPHINTAVAPETAMAFVAAPSLPSTAATAATASLLLPAAAPPSARPMKKLLQRQQQRRSTMAPQRRHVPCQEVTTSVVYPSTLYAPDLTLCPTIVHGCPNGSGATIHHSSSPHDWTSSQTTTSASSAVSSFLQQQYPKHT